MTKQSVGGITGIRVTDVAGEWPVPCGPGVSGS